MQHYNQKNIWILCVVGFIIGILYSNCVAKEAIYSLIIFDNYYLNQFVQTGSKDLSYFLHLIKIRMLPFVIIYLFRSNRLSKIVVPIFLFWTGFLCGIVFTSGAIKMGIKGILLSLFMMLPQSIFYFWGYAMLIYYVDKYNIRNMEYHKLIFCIAYICIGIVLEFYINPVMVKFFIKMI